MHPSTRHCATVRVHNELVALYCMMPLYLIHTKIFQQFNSCCTIALSLGLNQKKKNRRKERKMSWCVCVCKCMYSIGRRKLSEKLLLLCMICVVYDFYGIQTRLSIQPKFWAEHEQCNCLIMLRIDFV